MVRIGTWSVVEVVDLPTAFSAVQRRTPRPAIIQLGLVTLASRYPTWHPDPGAERPLAAALRATRIQGSAQADPTRRPGRVCAAVLIQCRCSARHAPSGGFIASDS